MQSKAIKIIMVAAVWILLTAISLRSGYSIRDVKSLNWDIALMLTPWGFIHNFLIVPGHYLRPYYDSLAERGSLAHDPLLATTILVTLIASISGLIYFRRTLGPRDA